MTSFSLVINSTNLSNPNTNGEYTYNFIGGGFKVDDDMEMMVSSAQIPYSIFNITEEYNNNTFKFSFPNGNSIFNYTQPDYITFSNGFYTITDLNSYLENYFITNGYYLIDNNGKNVFYIKFYLNSNAYAVQMLLLTVPRSLPVGWTQPTNWIGYSTYTNDRTPIIEILNTNKFSDFIGFIPNVYPYTLPFNNNSYSILSNKKPPISSYVNSILIHCSLVNNPVISPSDILDGFQITNTPFGSNITYQPKINKYVKLNKGSYSSMVITLTDQNNEVIYFNDYNILITLIFKKKKKSIIR